MTTLYTIDQRIQEVLNAADPETGEIDGSVMADLQISKSQKQENVAKFIRHLENDETVLKAEIDRLRKMADLAAKRQEWLKKYLKQSMEIDGIKELDYTVFKVKIAKNPPSVVIESEIGQIPEKYVKVTFTSTVDKKALKEAIQAGERIPGVSLVQTERLVIK